jgi:NCAIR mutase (PurE)-related protein
MPDWDHTPDLRREERLGFDEAIFCMHKTADQIARILEHATTIERSLLLTRLRDEQFTALPTTLQDRIDYDVLSGTGLFGVVREPGPKTRIAVVSAGTSDACVVHEAVRTLRYYGEACHELHDVGVAGLWRLLERIDEIRRFPVAIVAAGMDGALPSVLTGLIPSAVIAVPVSTGYGVAAAGHTALNAALSSCAPGLTVVNIDNGYGAACAALRVVRMLSHNDGNAV